MTTVVQTPPQQLKRTALAAEHEKRGAKMVDFHGWWMPLYYTGIIPPPADAGRRPAVPTARAAIGSPSAGGGIIDEHRCVRERVGLFDVSHMGQVFISGPKAGEFLQRTLTNDVAKLTDGHGQYSLMLNEAGGILDDVILFRLASERFLLIINCGTRERDMAWLRSHAGIGVTLDDVSNTHGIIAVQGPKAAAALSAAGISVDRLERFTMQPLSQPWTGYVSRTGYTGSDGFELFVPNEQAVQLWPKLLEVGQSSGAQPIGLGARDSLRLEVGYRLYSVDMDERTTPDEAGLQWVVAVKKGEFIGREALLKRRAAGITRQLVGFTMLDAGMIPRAQYPIQVDGRAVGHVTSGSLSPLLGIAVGMGYVETAFVKSSQPIAVAARGRTYRAQVIKLPFVKA